MKRVNWKITGLLGAASCIVISGFIIAMAVQGANIFPGQSGRANYSYTGNGTSFVVEPGNVTYVDFSGDTVVTHWVGFYGNVSGNLTLEDSSGNVFYDWVGVGTATGEIFAANVSSVVWSSVNCTNSSQINDINNFLNITISDRDSINNTYPSSAHPSFNVAGVSIPANTCNSTNVYSNGAKDPGLFSQVILADSNNCPIFTTLINSSSASFEGNLVDFQLLAGVKNSGLTSLYFFMELG